jgi:hypothetical protein
VHVCVVSQPENLLLEHGGEDAKIKVCAHMRLHVCSFTDVYVRAWLYVDSHVCVRFPRHQIADFGVAKRIHVPDSLQRKCGTLA